MAFIMPAFANNKKPLPFICWLALLRLLVLGALCDLPLSTARAEDSPITVELVDLSLEGSRYLLSANIDYRLTNIALEALQKGIPLYWDVRIKLVHQRQWLWDRRIIHFNVRYRIHYRALLNRYLVTNISTGENESFVTLSTALSYMATIRKLTVFDQAMLIPGERYALGIKVRFDHETLPLPLRPVSYFNPHWQLSSDWYLWPVEH